MLNLSSYLAHQALQRRPREDLARGQVGLPHRGLLLTGCHGQRN